MKKILRILIPQWAINNFWHLPQAALANLIYGFPSRNLKVIGVTGTDGKTTTVNMIYRILKAAGKKASMISTINAVVAKKAYDTGLHVTSPDPMMLQKFISESVKSGDEYMVLEVTSHGLDQYRFWGIKFEVGVITNITHEHLDYHKTFENYQNAKLKLLKEAKWSVVNSDLSQTIRRSSNVLLFGKNQGDFSQKKYRLKLKMAGGYNLENALASLAVAFCLGIDNKVAVKTLGNFTSVDGRMEEIKNNKGIRIFIDFAHTPNGLEQALRSLRLHTRGGKLIAVFGSAGKRDVEKRFLMGKVAGDLADMAVITAEDPRGELQTINQQIAAGLEKKGFKREVNYFVEGNRAEAIKLAISFAKKGDTVGIFGKGHEKSMNLDGKREIPWSDFEAVKKALF